MIAAAAALTGCGSKKSASTYKPRYEKVVYSFPQSDDDATQRLLSEAKMWLGTPYRYGGNDRGGVDCSGLVVQVYQRALGIKLPRVSREQADAVEAQSRERLLPGDLVFFATGRDPQRISHVGIFLGDGKMIHSSTKNGVVVADILSGYFDEHFRKAGRVPAFHSMRSSAASTKNKKEKPSKKKKKKEKSNAAKADVAPVTPPDGAQIQPPMPEAREVWQYEVVNSTPSSAGASTPSDPAPRSAPKKRKGQRSPTPPPAGATMNTPETSAPRTGSTSVAPTREAAPEPAPSPSAAAAPAPAKTEKPKAPKPAKPAPEKPAKPAKPAAKSPEPQNDSPATSAPDPDAARAKVLSRLKLD